MAEKILVTGGAGFIGSHLVDSLIREGYSVIVIDNLSKGLERNVNKGAKFYKVDIRSPSLYKIFSKERPSFVFHYAAHIEARASVREPISDAETNIVGSINVLESCRLCGVKKIIFASSGGEIYGSAQIVPTPETCDPKPISPYGVTKLAVEKYLDVYFKIFRIPYVSLRYGNVYGPRQNSKCEAGVVSIFIEKITKNNPVLIHGDGKQTRDYIFIRDAIVASLVAFKRGKTGVYNIGTGRDASVLEIFDKIKLLCRSNSVKVYTPFPFYNIPRVCLSIEKAKKELNWRPDYTLEDGLKETVNWFKENKWRL